MKYVYLKDLTKLTSNKFLMTQKIKRNLNQSGLCLLLRKQHLTLLTESSFTNRIKTHRILQNCKATLSNYAWCTVCNQPTQRTHVHASVNIRRNETIYSIFTLHECECMREPNINDDFKRNHFPIEYLQNITTCQKSTTYFDQKFQNLLKCKTMKPYDDHFCQAFITR